MTDNSTIHDLVATISEGRACLLLGQDHTDGLVRNVTTEASSLASTPVDSLRQALALVDLSTLAALMAEHLASRRVPLIELASLPWSSVVSTAVDADFLGAFAAASTTRRLVEVPAERIALTHGAHSPATLHLFRALGRVGASGDLAPPDAQSLPGKLLLKLPRALDALPQLLGTRGVLVVEGMTANGWLDSVSWEALGHVLRKIPTGRTFWFGWAPSSLREALAHDVNFIDQRLTSALSVWASDTELSAHLAVGRQSVFGVDDHVVSLGLRQARKSVRFSAKDWREIRRVGAALDDVELDQLHALESEVPAGGLAAFTGRAHIGVPVWAAAARGYCFGRDATANLVNAVVEYLSSPKRSLLDPDGAGQMRRPLFLSGPPAIGKSVGLLRVAWELRSTHRLFVLWLLLVFQGLTQCRSSASVEWPRPGACHGRSWWLMVRFPTSASASSPSCCLTGRRVILLGTETALVDDDDEPAPGYTRFPVDMTLSPERGVGLERLSGETRPPRLRHRRRRLSPSS